jgi:hypothetical protein
MAAAIARVLDGERPDTEALKARAAEFSLDRALDSYLALLQQPPGP